MSIGIGGPRYRKRVRVGRLQIGIRVYTHRNTVSPDRWVFQPELIYDRKRKP